MNHTPIKVQEFFSELLKKSVAKEIFNVISNSNFPQEAVNVDFHVKDGKMRSTKPWNTQFQCDADSMVECKKVLHYLTIAEDPTKEDIDTFENWRMDLAKELLLLCDDSFKSNVRKLVFGEDSPEVFPLNTIKVYDIDITNRPENDKVLVVKKEAPQGIQTHPVTAELIKEHEETGRDVSEIIAEKKKNEDIRYNYTPNQYPSS
jgi:hypothetical protein